MGIDVVENRRACNDRQSRDCDLNTFYVNTTFDGVLLSVKFQITAATIHSRTIELVKIYRLKQHYEKYN